MNRQSVKTEVMNEIIINMAAHLNEKQMNILEHILIGAFADIKMERMQTLPMEMKDSVTAQNEYVIKLFLYKKKKLKEATKYNYLNSVKRLLLLLNKPLTQVDEMDIYRYLDWYESRNIKNGGKRNTEITVNNERRNLSAFYSWMRKEKLIAENPVDGIEPLKTVRKPIDYYDKEEMARLKDGCRNLRERALIEVLRSTGARVGEIVGITLDMVNWDTGDIMICGEKSDRYRPIYLDAEAKYHYKKYLESRCDDNPSLFVTLVRPYKTLSRDGIRRSLKEISGRSGLTCRVYPHKFRKTLGMDLKNSGVDIGTIQEILGHASPNVTANYYAQSTPDTLRMIRRRAA